VGAAAALNRGAVALLIIGAPGGYAMLFVREPLNNADQRWPNLTKPVVNARIDDLSSSSGIVDQRSLSATVFLATLASPSIKGVR
jgi:hypothetical protein